MDAGAHRATIFMLGKDFHARTELAERPLSKSLQAALFTLSHLRSQVIAVIRDLAVRILSARLPLRRPKREAERREA